MLKAKRTDITEQVYTLDLAPKDPFIFKNSMEQKKKTNCKAGGIKIGSEVEYNGNIFLFYDNKKNGYENMGNSTLISPDGTVLVKHVDVEKIQ